MACEHQSRDRTCVVRRGQLGCLLLPPSSSPAGEHQQDCRRAEKRERERVEARHFVREKKGRRYARLFFCVKERKLARTFFSPRVFDSFLFPDSFFTRSFQEQVLLLFGVR